jgi:membrane-bound serine protease (ClpP class)
MCHLVFFLPIFGLPVFWIFPFSTALPLYLFIVGVSMLLYYKIYQAMTVKVLTGQEAMVGRIGVVVQDIDPEGKIQCATEIWNAIAAGKKFLEGEKVVISGFFGLNVVVEETPVKMR